MAGKPNLKSVRLSDEVLEFIQNFEGDGFNQKFENLVLFCMKEEASIKERIAFLDEQLSNRQKLLDKLRRLEIESERASRLLGSSVSYLEDYAKFVRGMDTNLK